RLVSASVDQTVRVWDVASGREEARWPVRGACIDLCLLPAGDAGIVGLVADTYDQAARQRLATMGALEGALGTGEALPLPPPASRGVVYSVARSPDGGTVAAACQSGLHLIDCTAGTSRTLSWKGAYRGVAFTPDGRALAAGTARVVQVWDVASGELLRTLP